MIKTRCRHYKTLWLGNNFQVTALQPKSDLMRHIVEVQRSHTNRHTHTHSVGLLWTSDQLVAEVTTYTINTSDKYLCFQWGSNSQSQKSSSWNSTSDSTDTGIGNRALHYCKLRTKVKSKLCTNHLDGYFWCCFHTEDWHLEINLNDRIFTMAEVITLCVWKPWSSKVPI
jgi:hypothetical protein